MLRHQVGVFSQLIAGALDLGHHGMMQQSVQQYGSHHRIAEDLSPLCEVSVSVDSPYFYRLKFPTSNRLNIRFH